ncbi:hypothetical protein [Desulfuromonas acetoxidans]|uniref:Uncharacterized protein n=1 Tax=Desulfuromonas acetoxidans (strain DSM 684 / 11070) TaxID=281689 RepID=Q1JWF3_DESA6|nr:hypothetical protein [Desulfuromonas acetoxidans]EAT14615.1 hypothetical protein Dace_0444 [Desulfuromonas acetoxidans DSM 684]
MKKNNYIMELMLILLLTLYGCGDDSSSRSSQPSEVDAESFTLRAVELWEDYDYSMVNPDGTTDSDGDGDIDADDAVVFVETFQEMGYSVPPTTVQGLFDNEYTSNGYAEDGSDPDVAVNDFSYTLASSVTQDDLKNMRWELLSVGDIIFIDYDNDFVWDNAAIYLGAYGEFDHAAFFVSDYYDKALVVDLDWDEEIINLDISFGYSAVRTPDYENISADRL